MGFFASLRRRTSLKKTINSSITKTEESKETTKPTFTKAERDFYASRGLPLPNVVAAPFKKEEKKKQPHEHSKPIPIIHRDASGKFPMGGDISHYFPQHAAQDQSSWPLRQYEDESPTTQADGAARSTPSSLESAAGSSSLEKRSRLPALFDPISHAARRMVKKASHERSSGKNDVLVSRSSSRTKMSSVEPRLRRSGSGSPTNHPPLQADPLQDPDEPSVQSLRTRRSDQSTSSSRYSEPTEQEWLVPHRPSPPTPLHAPRVSPRSSPTDYTPSFHYPRPYEYAPSHLSHLIPATLNVPDRSLPRIKRTQDAANSLKRNYPLPTVPPTPITPIIQNVGAWREPQVIIRGNDLVSSGPRGPSIPPRSINRPVVLKSPRPTNRPSTATPPPSAKRPSSATPPRSVSESSSATDSRSHSPATTEEVSQQIVSCQHSFENRLNAPRPRQCHICCRDQYQYLEMCRACALRVCYPCIREMNVAMAQNELRQLERDMHRCKRDLQRNERELHSPRLSAIEEF